MVNIFKHNVSFQEAQKALLDRNRVILADLNHSTDQGKRFICIGKVSNKVCAVRYTIRNNKVRIFGAGYWRKERKIYEKYSKNKSANS